jgi:hypothetical protein
MSQRFRARSDQEPAADREKDKGHRNVKWSRGRKKLDTNYRSHNDARKGADKEWAQEAAAALTLPPVLPERSRCRDDVVEQVRRRDRRARRAEDAHLKGEEKYCS